MTKSNIICTRVPILTKRNILAKNRRFFPKYGKICKNDSRFDYDFAYQMRFHILYICCVCINDDSKVKTFHYSNFSPFFSILVSLLIIFQGRILHVIDFIRVVFRFDPMFDVIDCRLEMTPFF